MNEWKKTLDSKGIEAGLAVRVIILPSCSRFCNRPAKVMNLAARLKLRLQHFPTACSNIQSQLCWGRPPVKMQRSFQLQTVYLATMNLQWFSKWDMPCVRICVGVCLNRLQWWTAFSVCSQWGAGPNACDIYLRPWLLKLAGWLKGNCCPLWEWTVPYSELLLNSVHSTDVL